MFNIDTHIRWRRAVTEPWWGPRSANTWTCLDLLVCPFTLKHREREKLRVKQSTVYVVNISRFHGGNVSSTGIDTTLPQSDTFNLVLPWDRGTNVLTPGLRFYNRPDPRRNLRSTEFNHPLVTSSQPSEIFHEKNVRDHPLTFSSYELSN